MAGPCPDIPARQPRCPPSRSFRQSAPLSVPFRAQIAIRENATSLLPLKRTLMTTNRRQFLQGSLAIAALPHLTPSLLAQPARSREDELWYTRPAERWMEALPIGNGRLGGMVFGGTQMERVALSESTAWSGAPATGEVNPQALPHLQQIR